jgi:hypothetical protein
MELGIAERVILLSVLPASGNIATMRILRDLKASLGFTEEELESAGVRQEGGSVAWDPSCGLVKEVEIGEVARGIIVESFEKQSEAGKIDLNSLAVYELFTEDPKPPLEIVRPEGAAC